MSRVLFIVLTLLGSISHHLHAYELAIGAIFYNEAPYLKEWVEYHRLAGVEHFWLYDNASTDNWQEVLEPYIEQGLVEVAYWPGEAILLRSSYTVDQIRAYRDAITQATGNTTWLALIDIDEFLVPMQESTVQECLNKHFSDASAVYISWRNFGTSHVYIPQGEPILAKLTSASFPEHSDNAVCKSIVRPECVYLKHIWSPHFCTLTPDSYYVNGNHDVMSFTGTDLKTDGRHYNQYICINHYVLRDEGFYHNSRLKKANRGYGNKNLLLEHYDSFSKTKDYSILNFIKKNHPLEYQQIWGN